MRRQVILRNISIGHQRQARDRRFKFIEFIEYSLEDMVKILEKYHLLFVVNRRDRSLQS